MIEEYIEKYKYKGKRVRVERFSDREEAFIRSRWEELRGSPDVEFLTGSPDDTMPNELYVRYKDDDEEVPFAILIRLCPCENCRHPDKSQYWCYKEDCDCCSESCT